MAAKKKEVEEGAEAAINSASIVGKLMDSHKKQHLNHLDSIHYTVSSGSLLLDSVALMTPGSNRIVAEGANLGKTSLSLAYLRNFLKVRGRRGIYFNAEGRIGEIESSEIIARSGIKMTRDWNSWSEEFPCLIIDSNVFEFIFSIVRELVMSDDKNPIMYIFDSTDAMIREDDINKEFSESGLVAGGALITAVFQKKVALALAKKGHMAIWISQYRSNIAISKYDRPAPRQGNSSGGAAIIHYTNLCLNIQQRYGGDLILENPNDKKSKILGHYCTVSIEKSSNEKNKVVVKIPIKYGQTDGNSVWLSKEISDLCQSFELISSKGAWSTFDEVARKELMKEFPDLECPEKFNGISKFEKFLEDNPRVVDYYYNKFLEMLSE